LETVTGVAKKDTRQAPPDESFAGAHTYASASFTGADMHLEKIHVRLDGYRKRDSGYAQGQNIAEGTNLVQQAVNDQRYFDKE
jgi:hypothetical protein